MSIHIQQVWLILPRGFIGKHNPLFRRGNEESLPVVHAYQNCLLLKLRCTLMWFERLGNINGLGHCMSESHHCGSYKMTHERTTVLLKVKTRQSSISTPGMLWWLYSSLGLKVRGPLWYSEGVQQSSFNFTSVLWLSLKDHLSLWGLATHLQIRSNNLFRGEPVSINTL